MPIKCEFRPNGVIIWHSGIITGKDLLDANHEIYSYQYNQDLQFQLADLTKVEKFDVSKDDMAALAIMDSEVKKDNCQYACSVAPTDLLFGLSRTWNIQAESENFITNVVRNRDEALAWYKSHGIIIEAY